MMSDGGLRKNLAWLIAIRAIIGTILLGSAVVVQITAPGSFPVNPFFFLIGLTYGLTILYGLTPRFVDRCRWLTDLQLAAAGYRTDPWLAATTLTLPPGSVARYTVALNVVGFFGVALLSGSLADSQR